jgi:hypothetical protein
MPYSLENEEDDPGKKPGFDRDSVALRAPLERLIN